MDFVADYLDYDAPEIPVATIAAVKRISEGQMRVTYATRRKDGLVAVCHLIWDRAAYLAVCQMIGASAALLAAEQAPTIMEHVAVH